MPSLSFASQPAAQRPRHLLLRPPVAHGLEQGQRGLLRLCRHRPLGSCPWLTFLRLLSQELQGNCAVCKLITPCMVSHLPPACVLCQLCCLRSIVNVCILQACMHASQGCWMRGVLTLTWQARLSWEPVTLEHSLF